MIWRDLVVPRTCSDERIGAALATALGVRASEVAVSPSIDTLASQAVFVLRTDVAAGRFGSVLSVYLHQVAPDDDKAIAAFALSLAEAVLAADDEPADPYAMRLFSPGARPEMVRMDAAELDEGRYALATDKCGRPASNRTAITRSRTRHMSSDRLLGDARRIRKPTPLRSG
jgi:hypothetical protein